MVFAPTAECYGGLSQVLRRFREGLQGEYREGPAPSACSFINGIGIQEHRPFCRPRVSATFPRQLAGIVSANCYRKKQKEYISLCPKKHKKHPNDAFASIEVWQLKSEHLENLPSLTTLS